MSEKYDWYEKISVGESLQQGDFITNCTIVDPKEDVHESQDNFTPDIIQYDAVVMSQSCDIEENKVELILLCPYYLLSVFTEKNPRFNSVEKKENIRKGNMPRFNMLEKSAITGFTREEVIVDFGSVFSLPMATLMKIAREREDRLRLLPPYREHLSQSFARFFMRVGLPTPIPTFRGRS